MEVEVGANQNPRNRALTRVVQMFERSLLESLTELIEPVMKLILDITTVLILGLTFFFQSVSIVITLDTVLVGIIQSIENGFAKIITQITSFLNSEIERKAVGNAVISFLANMLYSYILYNIQSEVWNVYFYAPMIAFLHIHITVALFSARLEQDLYDPLLKFIFMLLLTGLTLMLIISFSKTSSNLIIPFLFLLKSNINSLCHGIDLLLKISNPGIDSSHYVGNYVIEISRLLFWLVLIIYQIKLNRTKSILLLMLMMHYLIAITIPIRKLTLKLIHDYYINNQFPKLTLEELDNVSSENCSVCLCEHNSESVKLPCQHILHQTCLNRILQQGTRLRPARCPICRAEIFTSPSAAIGGQGNNGATRDVIRVRIIAPSRFFQMAAGGIGMRGITPAIRFNAGAFTNTANNRTGTNNGNANIIRSARDVIETIRRSRAQNTAATPATPVASAAVPTQPAPANPLLTPSTATVPATQSANMNSGNPNRVVFRRIPSNANTNNATSSSMGTEYTRVDLNNPSVRRTMSDVTLDAFANYVDDLRSEQAVAAAVAADIARTTTAVQASETEVMADLAEIRNNTAMEEDETSVSIMVPAEINEASAMTESTAQTLATSLAVDNENLTSASTSQSSTTPERRTRNKRSIEEMKNSPVIEEESKQDNDNSSLSQSSSQSRDNKRQKTNKSQSSPVSK